MMTGKEYSDPRSIYSNLEEAAKRSPQEILDSLYNEYPECTHTSYVTCGCCGQEVCGECGKERYTNHRNPHSPSKEKKHE